MSEPTQAASMMPADLPEHARARIENMKEKKLFTSDLSVNEFVLVREAGFEPIGLVMGSSIFKVGRSLPSSKGDASIELVDTTRALYKARENAMSRMEEEADALDADGVIGVALTMNLSLDPNRVRWEQYRVWSKWSKEAGFIRPADVPPAGWFDSWADIAARQWELWCARSGWGQVPQPPWSQSGQNPYALGVNSAEFIAIGTAIRHRGGKPYRNAAGKPFQSDLSGQEFWMLIRSGYRPVGFVMGNCVQFVPPHVVGRGSESRSEELSAYTHALYDARELAIERLQDEAEALGAKGIVGVTVSEQQHAWASKPWSIGNAALEYGEVIELFVVGTAVIPTGEADQLDSPQLVLSANDTVAKAAGEGE